MFLWNILSILEHEMNVRLDGQEQRNKPTQRGQIGEENASSS